MDQLLKFVFPAIVFLLCVYGFCSELLTRRLQHGGVETNATIISVDRTIAFGLRNFLATFSKKKERDWQFGCDYILSLRFLTESGEETDVQTSVPARMRVVGGERMPYFMAGITVPIRYAPKHPKRLVVVSDEVLRRQSALWKLVVWGFCAALMLAVLVNMGMTVR